jgi:hypothetical protein
VTAPAFDDRGEPVWHHRYLLVICDLEHVRRLLSDLGHVDDDARQAAAAARLIVIERQINAERPRSEVAALAWVDVRRRILRLPIPSEWWERRFAALAARAEAAILWHMGAA